MKYGVISTDDDVLQGRPVFENTNVPVQTMFEYLEDGKSIERFLNDYPAVNQKQAVDVIRMAKMLITSQHILKENFHDQ